MAETRLKDELEATDVANFLRRYPLFHVRFPTLVPTLEMPRGGSR